MSTEAWATWDLVVVSTGATFALNPIGGESEGVSGGVVSDWKDEKKLEVADLADNASVRPKLDKPFFFLTVRCPGTAGGLGVTCILRYS